MTEFNCDLALSFVKRSLDIDGPTAVLFDEVAFDKFVSDHLIPESKRREVQEALAIGYAAYLREAKYHELDVKSIRTKLEAVVRAAEALDAALKDLSPDALQAMSDYALGSSMSSRRPDATDLKSTDPAILARSMFETEAVQPDYGFNVETDIETASRLSEVAKGALTYTRANRSGRRPNDRFAALLETARVVWELILQREFTLYEMHTKEGVTDADQFCFDVAKAADPEVEPKKIQRAARLASEEVVLSQLLAQLRR